MCSLGSRHHRHHHLHRQTDRQIQIQIQIQTDTDRYIQRDGVRSVHWDHGITITATYIDRQTDRQTDTDTDTDRYIHIEYMLTD